MAGKDFKAPLPSSHSLSSPHKHCCGFDCKSHVDPLSMFIEWSGEERMEVEFHTVIGATYKAIACGIQLRVAHSDHTPMLYFYYVTRTRAFRLHIIEI